MSDSEKLDQIKEALNNAVDPIRVGVCGINTDFDEGRASLARDLLDEFFIDKE